MEEWQLWRSGEQKRSQSSHNQQININRFAWHCVMCQNCNTSEARGKESFVCLTCKGFLHNVIQTKMKCHVCDAKNECHSQLGDANQPTTANHLTVPVVHLTIANRLTVANWQWPINCQTNRQLPNLQTTCHKQILSLVRTILKHKPKVTQNF